MNLKNTFAIVLTVILISYASFAQTKETIALSNLDNIETHLTTITKTPKSRNYQNIATLNSVADYIFQELAKHCDTVYYQPYEVNSITYKNVIGSIGLGKKKRIIVGAHYDVAGDQEGADDNASGVTGVLELARLLSKDTLKHRIDFVGYTLEEPPFFRTEQMGSYIHAKSLAEQKVPILGMVCLEMIGYFDEAKNSQTYPVAAMSALYGTKGDYITVVQKLDNGTFGTQFATAMTQQHLLHTRSFVGPPTMTGIDLSDHLNYWKFGYSAVMITDTAIFRNKNYHRSTDRMKTLNLEKMCLAIDEVYIALRGMCK